MKDFKYIHNIASDGEATIYLYDAIGCYVDGSGFLCDGISGSAFAHQLEYLQDVATKINIRINSIGGSVVEGYSIVSAILNSKVPCDTYIDGIAASIAGVIAMCGSKKYMADYGTLMLHNPSGLNDQKILDIVKGTLVTILATNTPLSEEKISEIMDAETYYTSEDAIALGLVDEIITSNKKVKVDTTDIYNLMSVYNKLIKPIQEMILVKNQLGLEETAVEETIVESITELQNANKALTDALEAEKNAKAELESKLVAFENEKAEAKKTEIEAMVNTYVVSGQIKEDEKASMIELATINFDSVKNMLSKIGTKKSPDILNTIELGVNADEKANWTIRDYEKKDPATLTKIYNENRELYDRMFNAFYKK